MKRARSYERISASGSEKSFDDTNSIGTSGISGTSNLSSLDFSGDDFPLTIFSKRLNRFIDNQNKETITQPDESETELHDSSSSSSEEASSFDDFDDERPLLGGLSPSSSSKVSRLDKAKDCLSVFVCMPCRH